MSERLTVEEEAAYFKKKFDCANKLRAAELQLTATLECMRRNVKDRHLYILLRQDMKAKESEIEQLRNELEGYEALDGIDTLQRIKLNPFSKSEER